MRVLFLLLAVTACGGASAPPSAPSNPTASSEAAAASAADPAPASPPSAPSEPAPAAASAGVPTACADASASVCTPASAFVERLCTKPHQDIALALFAKTTPFTRMYLRGKLDELLFDEEVLALRYHAVPKNGIQVGSAAGSYDVLRWDGTCSMAVDADAFSRTKPPKARAAHVQWHRLGVKTQDALIVASDAVKRAHARRGKECRGAMSGDVSASCAKADAALVDAIVDYVRGGAVLPVPEAP